MRCILEYPKGVPASRSTAGLVTDAHLHFSLGQEGQSPSLCHPSTPLLCPRQLQQGGRAGPVLAKRSRSLQKHQIFMLRKPWKASANASLGGNCARAWDQEKAPPPPLGKPCWRAGHSSLPGGRASPERSEKRLPLGG